MDALEVHTLEEIFLMVYHSEEVRHEGWMHINLTCTHWHRIARSILYKVNMMEAFNLTLDSPFACCGELSPTHHIHIRTDTGKVELPPSPSSFDQQSKRIQELAATCREASFGRGAQAVLDPDYRSALVLEPESFSTNFHPMELNIHSDIQRLLAPHWYMVNCKLYRLNIYPPGGFFKTHKDTPRGPNHLGSLVVVLPFPHEGGRLVIKQGTREEVLDAGWSLEGQKQKGAQWIAFFGNCDHWIEPVTLGYRVTLTYHLFMTQEPETTCIPTNEPIYLFLKEMLAKNRVKRGEKYGFFLQNEYSTAELHQALTSPLMALRGSDALLYSAAVALNMKAKFRAVFKNMFGNEDRYLDNWEQDEENQHLLMSKMIPKEGMIPDRTYHEEDPKDYIAEQFDAIILQPDDVQWCTAVPRTLRNLAGSSSVSTGNTPSTEGFYYQAILLISVSVPKDEEERKRKKKTKKGKPKRQRRGW